MAVGDETGHRTENKINKTLGKYLGFPKQSHLGRRRVAHPQSLK